MYQVPFQPTRPLRGATDAFNAQYKRDVISTHAPLAGRDFCQSFQTLGHEDFNPRAPCGARRDSIHAFLAKHCISTHAPLAGRDGTVDGLRND